MSSGYYIICIDCNRGVYLGKPVRVKYSKRENDTFGFSGLGDTTENDWQPCELGSSKLQHFLMLHRMHELRVFPEGIDKHVPGVDVPAGYPIDEDDPDPDYNTTEFFEYIGDAPDPDREADGLSIEVLGALRKLR